ncbi:MAG: putative DNA binding domain-containing protein [Acidobacteria bacterium]|nr:putative DNA binding domain-containing protein [Acidobacteriota bacterium]
MEGVLGDAELIGRIEGGESDRVEFTASTTDLDKFRQAICAFANDLPGNGEPGLLFVGLKDDGSGAGSTIDDGLLKALGGLRTDGKILPFPVMEVARKRLGDCDVAVIQVEPSDNPPMKVDGRCWIRTGPRRAQATAEEERRLTEKRRWGNIPYDMQGVPGATVEADLDMRVFENDYLPCAVSPEVLAENRRDRGEQLRALRLMAPNGAPTVTAILVLGRDPRYWFPGAYLQFVRYGGTAVTDEILDHAELSGPLPEQLREADRSASRSMSTSCSTSIGTPRKAPSAIPPTTSGKWYWREIAHTAFAPPGKPLCRFTAAERERLLWADDVRNEKAHEGATYERAFEGIARKLERLHVDKDEDQIPRASKEAYRRLSTERACPDLRRRPAQRRGARGGAGGRLDHRRAGRVRADGAGPRA